MTIKHECTCTHIDATNISGHDFSKEKNALHYSYAWDVLHHCVFMCSLIALIQYCRMHMFACIEYQVSNVTHSALHCVFIWY